MGVHIQVLYASVGALANPQSKIIGVALLYDDQRDVKYRVTRPLKSLYIDNKLWSEIILHKISFQFTYIGTGPGLKIQFELSVEFEHLMLRRTRFYCTFITL